MAMHPLMRLRQVIELGIWANMALNIGFCCGNGGAKTRHFCDAAYGLIADINVYFSAERQEDVYS